MTRKKSKLFSRLDLLLLLAKEFMGLEVVLVEVLQVDEGVVVVDLLVA